MGVHHAWGRTYKDLYQRYKAMTGHNQRWQNGFDCQGLWVEVEVERELGFKSKRDIEQYGIGEFVQRCKERVLKYARVITEQSIRLGQWMDWSDSYYTMSDENNYTIWRVLKTCHDNGWLYRGHDVMPWCPRCGRHLADGDRDRGLPGHHPYQPLRQAAAARPANESLLVWTTTPWTLTSNVAAAVHPELTYARVTKDGETLILAEPLAHKLSATAGRSCSACAAPSWSIDRIADRSTSYRRSRASSTASSRGTKSARTRARASCTSRPAVAKKTFSWVRSSTWR